MGGTRGARTLAEGPPPPPPFPHQGDVILIPLIEGENGLIALFWSMVIHKPNYYNNRKQADLRVVL